MRSRHATGGAQAAADGKRAARTVNTTGSALVVEFADVLAAEACAERRGFTELFSKKADIYDACRPRYAQRAFDELKAAGVLVPGIRAANVGCGTGIFTRQLACALGAGSEVAGVGPNDAMRWRAEELSAQEAARYERGEAHARECATLRFVRGSAEDTGLARGSVDVVAAAQAFHWFQPDAFRSECGRILNGGEGFVVLAWNVKQAGQLDADRKRIVERYREPQDVADGYWAVLQEAFELCKQATQKEKLYALDDVGCCLDIVGQFDADTMFENNHGSESALPAAVTSCLLRIAQAEIDYRDEVWSKPWMGELVSFVQQNSTNTELLKWLETL